MLLFFYVIPGGQPGSTVLEDIVTTSSSPYAWLCNLSEGIISVSLPYLARKLFSLLGTYITFQIRDALGNLQYSGVFPPNASF